MFPPTQLDPDDASTDDETTIVEPKPTKTPVKKPRKTAAKPSGKPRAKSPSSTKKKKQTKQPSKTSSKSPAKGKRKQATAESTDSKKTGTKTKGKPSKITVLQKPSKVTLDLSFPECVAGLVEYLDKHWTFYLESARAKLKVYCQKNPDGDKTLANFISASARRQWSQIQPLLALIPKAKRMGKHFAIID